MISCSHWGMFACTGRELVPHPQFFADAFMAGLITYYDSKYLHG